MNLDHARIEPEHPLAPPTSNPMIMRCPMTPGDTHVAPLPDDKSVRVTVRGGMVAALAQLIPAAAGQEAILAETRSPTGERPLAVEGSRVPIVT